MLMVRAVYTGHEPWLPAGVRHMQPHSRDNRQEAIQLRRLGMEIRTLDAQIRHALANEEAGVEPHWADYLMDRRSEFKQQRNILAKRLGVELPN